GSPSSAIEDAIEILRVCQTASDEAATLTRVCEQLQRQTQAAAVGIFGIEAGGLARLAAKGPKLETASAERAIDTHVFIAPHTIDARVEAAMPIQYAGAVIGAVGL